MLSPWQRLLTARSLFIGASVLLLFLSVVIPNSLQLPTAGMLAVCFLCALYGFRMVPGLKTIFLFYACSVMVTLIYIAVGFLNDAPWIAAAQVITIYVVSPMLWVFISAGDAVLLQRGDLFRAVSHWRRGRGVVLHRSGQRE
jgi:hypothetical protein